MHWSNSAFMLLPSSVIDSFVADMPLSVVSKQFRILDPLGSMLLRECSLLSDEVKDDCCDLDWSSQLKVPPL